MPLFDWKRIEGVEVLPLRARSVIGVMGISGNQQDRSIRLFQLASIINALFSCLSSDRCPKRKYRNFRN